MAPWVYPRIVPGKFPLLNEWRIEKEARKVCTNDGIHGHILVYRHQGYSQDAWLLPPHQVPEAGALCQAPGQLASQPPDFKARGACASCRTGFSVQGSRDGNRFRPHKPDVPEACHEVAEDRF